MPSSPHWRLSAWYFFYFAYIGAFAPYFTLYLQSLGLSATAISVLMSLMVAMRIVAPNLWGWLADHVGHRVLIVRASAVLSAAGFLVFFFTKEFPGLLFGMAILAFFWSAALPLVEALTLDHLDEHVDRYGRIRLWGSVGFIVAVLGTGAWLELVPLEGMLAVNFALLLGIVACALGLPEVPGRPAIVAAPLRTALRQHGVLALLVASLFMAAAHGPFYLFFSIHLVNHGYGTVMVGALWSLGVIAEILVFVVMPRLMQRYSLRAILLASFALAVLRFLVIGWLADSLLALVLAQLMHAATFGSHHAAAIAALNRWFPPQQQGRIQALYGSVSFGVGGMVGNLYSGQTWGTLGAAWTFSIAALLALVGWTLVWRWIASEPGRQGLMP